MSEWIVHVEKLWRDDAARWIEYLVSEGFLVTATGFRTGEYTIDANKPQAPAEDE